MGFECLARDYGRIKVPTNIKKNEVDMRDVERLTNSFKKDGRGDQYLDALKDGVKTLCVTNPAVGTGFRTMVRELNELKGIRLSISKEEALTFYCLSLVFRQVNESFAPDMHMSAITKILDRFSDIIKTQCKLNTGGDGNL